MLRVLGCEGHCKRTGGQDASWGQKERESLVDMAVSSDHRTFPLWGPHHRTSNSNWCRGKKLSPCFTSALSVGAALVAQRIKRLPTMPKTRVQSLSGEDPWRRKWQPTPVLLPGESHGQRSLAGYNPWGLEELDMTESLHVTSLSMWTAF